MGPAEKFVDNYCEGMQGTINKAINYQNVIKRDRKMNLQV